nr:hypothetical protein 10 [Balneolaceae bacterium]
MKKLISTIFLCLMTSITYSQNLVIELNSGETFSFNTANISSMYFSNNTPKKFAISNSKVPYGTNYNQICRDEFGIEWGIADWTDLKTFYSKGGNLESLASRLDFQEKRNAWITRRGDQSYSRNRDYFASFHNHNKPSNYLAHDNINEYYFSLGSWDNTYYVLCRSN